MIQELTKSLSNSIPSINYTEPQLNNIQEKSFNEILDIEKSINEVNELLKEKNLKVELNRDINMIQIKEFDETGEIVLKSTPPEEYIKRVKYFKENILPSLLLDEKV